MNTRSIKLLFIFIVFGQIAFAQYPSGYVEVDYLYSPILKNPGGENPTRRVSIYLPPGYDESNKRYPVIYFLHGFAMNDSLFFESEHFNKLMDKAIATGRIKPVILVMPNEYTLYRGSWYTNSSLTGNWADFTAMDVVAFIDKNYKTLAEWESRGIAGHSMGGQGAIKMGMLYPEVFSSVYALSPATLALTNEFGIGGFAYKHVQEIQTNEELINGWDIYANAIIAMGRAYTPNQNKPPFYCDLPFLYKNDSLIVDEGILEIWNKKSVIGMVDNHIDALKKLTALKLDWGRNENHPHIPVTCRIFSIKLENLGIEHYAEEFIGDHLNKLLTEDGRVFNDMLPFFDTYLKFEK